jgi:hypothetical protein
VKLKIFITVGMGFLAVYEFHEMKIVVVLRLVMVSL